jgi:protocatechuate 3,4-dioxygenase beta subunit
MTRALIVAAFVLFPFVAPAQTPVAGTPQPGMMRQQPARDAAKTATGTATIRGRVVASDTGQPLRRAVVRAFSSELRENRVATTDADGRYTLKELPAGRYSVTALKGGYVTLSYGQTRPFEPGRPLQLADGETLEKVDFSLPSGGVVAGRIVDEYGEPVTDVQVIAMRYTFAQGRRRLTPAGRESSTNDIGEYRIFGLPPGDYYVSATVRNVMFGDSDDHSGYAPTYYPGTPSIAEAQKVTVGLGQTAGDINMALASTRTARVSGTAIGSDGRPMTAGFVSLIMRSGTMMFGSNGGQVRSDGSFSISNVAPGEYTLQVNTGGGPFGDGDYAAAHVTVAGQDVTGIQLMASKPVVVRGRVVFGDQEAAKSIEARAIQVGAIGVDVDDGMMQGRGNARVHDDFTFELKVRPGRSVIRAGMNQPGWTLQSVHLGGADVTDSGIDFRADEDVDGLVVELTNHPAEVTGTVTDAHGDPVKDYSVLVFAHDRQQWTATSRYFGFGRPDQDGRYKATNLPAGDYDAIALESVEPGEARDPDLLDRLVPLATRFTLGEGEAKALDLRLQRRP